MRLRSQIRWLHGPLLICRLPVPDLLTRRILLIFSWPRCRYSAGTPPPLFAGMALAVGIIICLLGSVLCIRMIPFGFILNSHSASKVSFYNSRRPPASHAPPDRTVCHCIDRSMFTNCLFLACWPCQEQSPFLGQSPRGEQALVAGLIH